jgi:hypothetical protein
MHNSKNVCVERGLLVVKVITGWDSERQAATQTSLERTESK